MMAFGLYDSLEQILAEIHNIFSAAIVLRKSDVDGFETGAIPGAVGIFSSLMNDHPK